MISYDFSPHILQPTRITDHTATLIDSFFNSNEFVATNDNLVCDLPDHLPNFLILNKLSWTARNVTRFARDYSCFDQDNLLADAQSVQWDNVFWENGIIQMFDSFYSVIDATINKHAPLKKLSKREAKFKSKTKNKLFKHYITCKSQFNHSRYKIYRNKLKHILFVSKKLYC